MNIGRLKEHPTRSVHTATVRILIAPSTASPTLVLPALNWGVPFVFLVWPVKNLLEKKFQKNKQNVHLHITHDKKENAWLPD